ncbi:U1 snRNP protein [Marasmius tenuissimus]|uniref:U1 snRNP protein n=1 Tax=Marasmius tenuissimus TaxID=585030 RepID=A0ABR2ZZN1_9AGAR
MNWTEHRNPEGRTYWFNTVTKESVWEKPDDLKTPFERALNQTKWKEYFSGGRKYYYNTETKESKWDMPDELLLVLEKVEKEGTAAPAPSAAQPAAITAPESTGVAGGPASDTPIAENAIVPHTGALPLSSSSVLPARPDLPDDPLIPHNGFATVEEGEKAFTHLLRKAGVDANWTWDQTMRAIITDPLYKALNTLAEKKAAFEKYTTNLKVKEAEEKEARLAKLRPALRNMLKGNPNVFHYSTFGTADKLFSQHPIWQQAKIEAERRLIFEEYVAELKQREVQESRAARARSVAKVVNLFKELDVDVLTRWATAYKRITDTEEWISDPELQTLPRLDILLAFEDYSRVREREFEEQTRRAQVEKTRKERKAREAFKQLLQGLVESGKIKARTKWKEVYPLFKDDERYLNMLGNPGSNQLELFWDVVDVLDQRLDATIAVVTDAIERNLPKESEDTLAKGYPVTPETAEDEFLTVAKALEDDGVKQLSERDLHAVFASLLESAKKKQADEKRRAERRLRHLQDDLRYALRKLPEPLDVTLAYEAAVPLIEHLPEYKAIEDEESRRNAFAKFVKRQKDRLRETAGSEDGGSTASRKRKEPTREDRDTRDRERDRDRERTRDKDRERDRDRERERSYRDRGKDHDKDGRDSRHYRHDDYDRSRRGSRADYDRDRDRDYRSSRHGRDDRDDRRRDRERDRDRERTRSDHTRDWEDGKKKSDRDRSVSSAYREEPSREKRDLEDKGSEARAEKRPRLESEAPSATSGAVREDTPEEGEI